jgi:fructosamine-3-kinase
LSEDFLVQMSLWNSIAAGIADATGNVAELRQQGSVGGGCINQAQRIEYGVSTYFVKFNTAGQLDMFAAEAEGLNELRRCHALRIPAPVCWGEDDQSAYLVRTSSWAVAVMPRRWARVWRPCTGSRMSGSAGTGTTPSAQHRR